MDAILKQLNVLESRVSSIESTANLSKAVKQLTIASCSVSKKPEPKPAADEDDVDLFGSDSDEENAAAAKVREERLKAYAAKKARSK